MSLRLNLGSGNNLLPGFINVDKYDDEADIKADLVKLPFPSDSTSEVVAYQVIEHIPYNQSEQVLREIYRVLEINGTAIIETPDIDVIAKRILDTGEISDNTIFNLVGEYYRPHDKGRYEDWEMCAAAIHRNPWNFRRLEELAKRIGFVQVSRIPWENSKSKFEENLAVCLVK